MRPCLPSLSAVSDLLSWGEVVTLVNSITKPTFLFLSKVTCFKLRIQQSICRYFSKSVGLRFFSVVAPASLITSPFTLGSIRSVLAHTCEVTLVFVEYSTNHDGRIIAGQYEILSYRVFALLSSTDTPFSMV